jgi:protein involved in polysaccharide export with SLBB domain
MKTKNLISIFTVVFSILFGMQAVVANAATPTAAQIAQFQKMSPEQQKILAKQFGFDLDSIKGSLNQPETDKAPPVVMPREIIYESTQDTKLEGGTEQQKQLIPFGYDLFAGEPTSFSPVTDIPIPSEYIMGPGDEVVIQLYGKQNDIYRLTVSRNGNVQFPELGPISIAGLNFDDAKKLLQKRIKNQIIGVESSISLGGLRSMRIFVLGDAYKPGSYEVSSLSTITNALFVSGGIKTIGSLRNIQLKRRGKLISSLDLYDLLLKGDTSNDLRLLPGDVVFIPSVGGRVSVDGEVIRPAIYEIKKNETLSQLLKMVGGLKPTANAKTALLNRVNKKHVREAIDIDLSSSNKTSLKLSDGDELIVGEISDYVQSTVKLSGAITRDGLYKWKPGLRVSNVIKNLKTDLRIDADLGYSIIVREINLQGEIKVLQFSLGGMILNPGNEVFDPELQSNDELIIFSKRSSTIAKNGEEIKDALNQDKDCSRKTLLEPILKRLEHQRKINAPYKSVSLSGEVRFPGEYPLSEGLKVKGLLGAGGGLKDSAYTLSTEITRTNAISGEAVKIDHFQLDLAGVMQDNAKENISLQSRDTITVRIKPEWNDTARVEIKGEVNFPGTYVIERGETLSQLIVRAGGITELSYPKGAVFMREELRKREQQLIKEMQDRLKTELAAESLGESSFAKGSKDNAIELADELDTTQALGRLVINLPGILSSPEQNDLLLKNGDTLVVPSNSQTLTVIGQVQHPTSHIFSNTFSVDEYIKKSGGITAQADDDRIYIIKANGSVMIPNSSNWFTSTENTLEAGDTIVIPLDTAYTKPLTL